MAVTDALTAQLNNIQSQLQPTGLGVLKNAYNGIAQNINYALMAANNTAANQRMVNDPNYMAPIPLIQTPYVDEFSKTFTPPQVKLMNVASQTLNNGNPEFQKGYGQVAYGGDTFDIPESVLQQQQYTADVNRGRYNVDDYFLGSKIPAAGPYTDYNATKARIDALKAANPQVNGTGAINPIKNLEDQISTANQQIQAQKTAQTNGTEIRTAGGALVGGTLSKPNNITDLQAQIAESQKELTKYNSTGARQNAAQQATATQDALSKQFKGIINPTTSNLPIKETVIK